MIRKTLICCALLAFSATAFASSFAGSSAGASSAGSSASSGSSSSDDKVVLRARDDAASFVASEGQIRGVKLECALDLIRHQAPQLNATDFQLAQAILAI